MAEEHVVGSPWVAMLSFTASLNLVANSRIASGAAVVASEASAAFLLAVAQSRWNG